VLLLKAFYIDEFLLINFTADYFVLKASACLCGSEIRRGRAVASAAAGAAYACASYMYLPLRNIVFAVFVLVLMIYIAYGESRGLGKPLVIFCLVSSMFCGVYLAVCRGLYKNSNAISARALLLTVILLYILIRLYLKAQVAKMGKERYLRLKIGYGSKTVETVAVLDTGNKLKDMVYGRGVVVLNFTEAVDLLPENIAALIKRMGLDDPADILSGMACEKSAARFGIITFSTIGEAKGIMLTFRPDWIEIDGKNEQHRLLAFPPNPIRFEDKAVNAIIN